jgi:phosphoenolpyruvate synthase/pyruvate phosphate dikinase
MIQNLTALGVNIPDGFVVTVDAYYAYIKHNMLDQKLRILLMQLIMKALNHFEEVEWKYDSLKRKVSKKNDC